LAESAESDGRDGARQDEAARVDGQEAAWRGDREAAPEVAGDAVADQPEVDYWDRVEEFERLWEQHVERWPGAPEGERDWSRPGDPPGSWRGEGDRYLSPERNAEADQLIAALRAPEPDVTTMLRAIERDNTHGARLAGLEHRIKGTQRLKEKIVEKMRKELKSGLADVVSEISDAVRYTFSFDQNRYITGCDDIRERLKSAGCRATYSQDHWRGDEYKGINTRWVTSAGERFELQFHTRESFHAKQLTHHAYKRLRLPETSRSERSELHAFQREVSAAVPVPPGVAQILDHGSWV
jgi:hypothetical protein